MHIGQRIRNVVQQLGWTQEDVSRRIGRAAVGDFPHGEGSAKTQASKM